MTPDCSAALTAVCLHARADSGCLMYSRPHWPAACWRACLLAHWPAPPVWQQLAAPRDGLCSVPPLCREAPVSRVVVLRPHSSYVGFELRAEREAGRGAPRALAVVLQRVSVVGAASPLPPRSDSPSLPAAALHDSHSRRMPRGQWL